MLTPIGLGAGHVEKTNDRDYEVEERYVDLFTFGLQRAKEGRARGMELMELMG